MPLEFLSLLFRGGGIADSKLDLTLKCPFKLNELMMSFERVDDVICHPLTGHMLPSFLTFFLSSEPFSCWFQFDLDFQVLMTSLLSSSSSSSLDAGSLRLCFLMVEFSHCIILLRYCSGHSSCKTSCFGSILVNCVDFI